MSLKINFGCGQTPTKGWVNLDNSYALRLRNLYPLVVFLKLFKLINSAQERNIEFIRKNNIKFANATIKFRFKSNSVDILYSSHMLEHLPRNSASYFIKECHRVLKKGGILRIVVPDLKKHVNEYLIDQNADRFLETSLLVPPSIESIKSKILFFLIGYRHHQWMYDANSLKKLILNNGFTKVIEQSPGKTLIVDEADLNLYERMNDLSLYVEAIK